MPFIRSQKVASCKPTTLKETLAWIFSKHFFWMDTCERLVLVRQLFRSTLRTMVPVLVENENQPHRICFPEKLQMRSAIFRNTKTVKLTGFFCCWCFCILENRSHIVINPTDRKDYNATDKSCSWMSLFSIVSLFLGALMNCLVEWLWTVTFSIHFLNQTPGLYLDPFQTSVMEHHVLTGSYERPETATGGVL